MNARGLFVVLMIMGGWAALIGGAIAAATTASPIAWLGVALAGAVPALFVTALMTQRIARTSSAMPVLTGLAALGPVLSLAGLAVGEAAVIPLVFAIALGWIGFPVYVFWYSVLPKPATPPFAVGNPLPPFTLYGIDGATVPSEEVPGPALWMFFRGNWCPLCMAQIHEVAEAYKELSQRGVTVALISGQSEQATRKLAKKFDVPFLHLIDRDYIVAKQLGLFHENAVPPGATLMLGATSNDAMLPTVVVTDASGVVAFYSQTDNYRIRPDPRDFMQFF